MVITKRICNLIMDSGKTGRYCKKPGHASSEYWIEKKETISAASEEFLFETQLKILLFIEKKKK